MTNEERPDREIGAPLADEAKTSVSGSPHAFVVHRGGPCGIVRLLEVPAGLGIEAALAPHGAELDRSAQRWVAPSVLWGPDPLGDLGRAHPGLVFIDEYAYLPSELLDGDNRLGVPIPLGKHSDAAEDFARRALAAGLHPDRVEELTNWRGDDCGWGEQLCHNDPCAHDAVRTLHGNTCRELAHAFPHRRRAGASMRADGVIPGPSPRSFRRPLPHGTTVVAAELSGMQLRAALARAIHVALDEGRAAVVVGATNSEFVICTAGCCVRAAGVFVVIPGGVEVDTTSTEGRPPLWLWATTRRLPDQRECRIHTSVLSVKS